VFVCNGEIVFHQVFQNRGKLTYQGAIIVQPQSIQKIQDIPLHPQMVPIAFVQLVFAGKVDQRTCNGALDCNFVSQRNPHLRWNTFGFFQELRKFVENAVVYIVHSNLLYAAASTIL